MSSHNDSMDAEHPLVITRAEAEAGTQRTIRFHGPDGRESTQVVSIPPGVVTGSRVWVANDDWACSQLALVITVVPHQRYECRGDNLYLTLQVDRATALREGTIHVTIGSGKVIAVPIQPGMSHGRFVYGGLGLPRAHDLRRNGDLILRLELLDVESVQGDPIEPASSMRSAAAQAAQTSDRPARRWWKLPFGA